MAFTEQQIEDYIANQGSNCPYCHTIDCLWQDMQGEGTITLHRIKCEECGKSWLEVHGLVGIKEIEDNETT